MLMVSSIFVFVIFRDFASGFCGECDVVLMQSDREKEEGLPVAPFMDREKVTKPTAQIGFIKFVLLPMFETIAKARTLFDSLRVPQVSETKKRVVCIEQQSTTTR